MSAEIFQFPQSSQMEAHPTGAREAIRDAMTAANYLPHPTLEIHDLMLSELWVRGFKVVPITDDALVSISDQDVVIDPSVPDGMILVKDARVKNIVISMLFKDGGAKS